MTSKVTVDAHAGWSIRVTTIYKDGSCTESLVDANHVQDFHVHSGACVHVREVQPNEEPSFGESAVGRSFNPSGNSRVDRLKTLYAEIIDICNVCRGEGDAAAGRHWSIAITDAETAQMRAVKAATWK
jgi:hypothetical protein